MTEVSDLIFRPTQNLGKRIKNVPQISLAPADHPLLDWSATEFVFERRRYVILANTLSLYCTVIPIIGVNFPKTWKGWLHEGIKNALDSIGRYSDFAEFVSPEHRNVRISKSLNRSITSSLNMYVSHARIYMQNGVESEQIAHQLNGTPMSAIAQDGEDYGIPKICFETMVTDCLRSSGSMAIG